MSGLFFGLAFGLGGIGSAVLGEIADRHGIPFVFHICSYLPLIGLLTALLPNLGTPRRERVSNRAERIKRLAPPNPRGGLRRVAAVAMIGHVRRLEAERLDYLDSMIAAQIFDEIKSLPPEGGQASASFVYKLEAERRLRGTEFSVLAGVVVNGFSSGRRVKHSRRNRPRFLRRKIQCLKSSGAICRRRC